MITLLALELGPVEAFVSAARKTRDFWAGSWMMSELAKAAALAVVKACGDDRSVLIFPAPTDLNELDPESDLIVADKILAELPEGAFPADVAARAKLATHDRWLEMATDAWQRCSRSHLRRDIWNRQTSPLDEATAGDVVECYAAWVPRTANYAADRLRVEQLLWGRTNCRNFPVVTGIAGIPKSSLDGARESVLPEPNDVEVEERRTALRVTAGEQLDAFGLTKRVYGGKRQYPSTSRIAADPWLRGAALSEPDNYRALCQACESLALRDTLPRIRVDDPQQTCIPTYPQYYGFAYEGAAVFQSRHGELLEEATGRRTWRGAVIPRDLDPLKRALDGLTRCCGEPEPYYALFSADGDGVGAALSRIGSPQRHREFSQTLSAFAATVHQIVANPESGYSGVPVYIGGDDVIVLLPVDRAVECCAAIATAFRESLQSFAAPDASITLSGGLVLAHHSDALEDVLGWANSAKDDAKSAGKNSLMVHLQPRGGAPVRVCRRWGVQPSAVAADLQEWVRLLRSNDLPDKVAYDLRRLGEFYRDAATHPEWSSVDVLATAMKADALRLLTVKRKKVRELVEPHLEPVQSPADLVDLANWIIVARRVAQSQRQAEGAR